MGTLKEPSPDLFKYGFLTVRTARILSGLSSGRKFDDESRQVIIAAKDFMDQVLNGEALISGDTKNFSPSKEGLQAFQYGFRALGVMRQKRIITQLNSRDDTQLILTEIKSTLEGLLRLKHSTVILTHNDKVRKAANFFGIIAKSLCNEARNYPFMEDNEVL
jgi:hypothetical protein